MILGVNSDEDVIKIKGPPVLNQKERADIMRSCKYVDEVVEGTPYEVTVEILDKYNCDYYAHGDDIPTNASGDDAIKDVRD